MSFIALNNSFKQWFIKKGFQNYENEKKLNEALGQYCVLVKHWPSDWVSLANYSKNHLVIICKNSSIASQLKIEEGEIKNYLIQQTNNPKLQINRISFKVQ